MSDCKHDQGFSQVFRMAVGDYQQECRGCWRPVAEIIADLQAELAQARDMVVQYTSRELTLREKLAQLQEQVLDQEGASVYLLRAAKERDKATAEAATLALGLAVIGATGAGATQVIGNTDKASLLAWCKHHGAMVSTLDYTDLPVEQLERHDLRIHIARCLIADTPLAASMLRRLVAAEKIKAAVDELDGTYHWEIEGRGAQAAIVAWYNIQQARNDYEALADWRKEKEEA